MDNSDTKQPADVETAPRKPSRLRRAIKRAFKIGLGAFIAAHLYVLYLGLFPAPTTMTMMQRSAAGETIKRDAVKLHDISPYLIAAVIAAEDGRFCSHHGIDRKALEKAIEDNKAGGRRRGASTITQQTAKNLFLWNGGGVARKAAEAYAALLIDLLWSKETIMEHYLNIAEWGNGIFGAEAAAQARFGKSAKDLSKREAALLASVLPSPNKWRLDPPGEFVAGRAGTVQARMNVTGSQGYGDCVLNGHPGYDARDFAGVKVKPPTEEIPDAVAAEGEPEISEAPSDDGLYDNAPGDGG